MELHRWFGVAASGILLGVAVCWCIERSTQVKWSFQEEDAQAISRAQVERSAARAPFVPSTGTTVSGGLWFLCRPPRGR